MKTVLGSIRHLLATGNKTHMLWCIGILLLLLILAVLHHRWRDNPQKLKKWRWLALLPFLAALAHFLLYSLSYLQAATVFISIYFIGIISLIPVLFAKRRIGYRIVSTLTGVIIAFAGTLFILQSPNFFNYVRKSYTESFRGLITAMDRHYILKEWKEVDFAALEAKYMPLIQEAEKEQNPGKFYDAILQFSTEMHDGHIFVERNFDEKAYPSQSQLHEYGLTIVRLDDGSMIAVCTSEEVNKLGITDGTVITKWNGKPIEQSVEEVVVDEALPVKANQDRLAPMNLDWVGGETVEVAFLDKSGKEKTVTLSDQEDKHTHNEAFQAFAQISDIGSPDSFRKLQEENFSTQMLNDKCGYLKITMEGTANTTQDMLGYVSGNHKWAREMFRGKLRDLKAQGMEYLVIDMRNNMGGFDEIGCALCDLLTTGDWFGQGLGIRRNGTYTCVSEHGIHGDGEFADLNVVALTNYSCASAGDGTCLYLSKLPNVTVAGITDPNGCNQETGGTCVLSGGIVTVGFPTGLILDENSVPNVDTRADRISRNPVEERIPFDRDAAMKIFRDKEDYELNWAVTRLEAQAAG